MDDIFLKMSFCAENPPLKPQASAGKPRTAGNFPHYFYYISILHSPIYVMISIEIQRIGGLPNE